MSIVDVEFEKFVDMAIRLSQSPKVIRHLQSGAAAVTSQKNGELENCANKLVAFHDGQNHISKALRAGRVLVKALQQL